MPRDRSSERHRNTLKWLQTTLRSSAAASGQSSAPRNGAKTLRRSPIRRRTMANIAGPTRRIAVRRSLRFGGAAPGLSVFCSAVGLSEPASAGSAITGPRGSRSDGLEIDADVRDTGQPIVGRHLGGILDE